MRFQHKHIYRIRGKYYFRLRLPKRLATHLKRADIRLSLKTDDLTSASSRASILAAIEAEKVVDGRYGEDVFSQTLRVSPITEEEFFYQLAA